MPFKAESGELLDEGIAIYFRAPHSYTGEDVLELQGHGGPAVLRRVLDSCLAAGHDLGVRLAEPGEFTRRAFLNDRMDLAQAEAVADLIEASSVAAARGAMASLSGEFSTRVNDLSDRIIHLRMLVEATLDFPEEEIDFLEKYQARPTLDALAADLARLIAQARQGVILREGLHVVLAGQPGHGKSSLLNALAGDDYIAIVTPIAGTTRDKVVQEIHIDGVPLHIVDTAGLRETEDTVESIGIARTWQEIERADVILHLQDATQPGDELDAQITAPAAPHARPQSVQQGRPVARRLYRGAGRTGYFGQERHRPGRAACRTAADRRLEPRRRIALAGMRTASARPAGRRGTPGAGGRTRATRTTGCWTCSRKNCAWRTTACPASPENSPATICWAGSSPASASGNSVHRRRCRKRHEPLENRGCLEFRSGALTEIRQARVPYAHASA